MRGAPDKGVAWVIVIEATEADALIPTRGTIRSAHLVAAESLAFYPRYSLLFALTAAEAA